MEAYVPNQNLTGELRFHWNFGEKFPDNYRANPSGDIDNCCADAGLFNFTLNVSNGFNSVKVIYSVVCLIPQLVCNIYV